MDISADCISQFYAAVKKKSEINYFKKERSVWLHSFKGFIPQLFGPICVVFGQAEHHGSDNVTEESCSRARDK